MRTPVVNLVLDSMLPESMRDPQRVLDKKGVEDLMLRVAKEQPDLYPKVAQFLSEQGAKLAYRRGETFRLGDFKAPTAREAIFQELRKDVDRLRNSGLTGKELSKARLEVFGRYSERLADETAKEALANKNNIAMTVLSGARGKKPQLRDLLASPGFYVDEAGDPIPWFIERSFSEGLSTADFLAGSYAARGAVTESKKAVAKGGFLAKTFARVNARNSITMKDCGTSNGIDLPPDEKDLRGRILQRPAGGVEAGAVITRDVFSAVKKTGKPVIVRSPLTCEAPQGICAKCFGVTAEGKFPSVGDHVGATASNAIGEPMAQGALCLGKGTEVRMADFGVKRIEEIVPGDFVLGADKEGRTFPVEVLNRFEQGNKEVHRYEFVQGSSKLVRTLVATADHKILANKKISSAHYMAARGSYSSLLNNSAQILRLGDKNRTFSAVLPVSFSGRDLIHEPLAFMVGAMLGDGIRSPEGNNYTPMISCAEPKLVDIFNAKLAATGLRLNKAKRSHDYSIAQPYQLSRDKNKKNALKETLRRLGTLHAYAHDKRIPRECWNWDEESVIELINGYLVTDGSVYNGSSTPIIGFGSVSKGLLEDLQDLLSCRLGIYGGQVNAGEKSGTNGYKHDAWTWVISREDQVRKFSCKLNPPGRKGELLKKLLKKLEGRAVRHPEPFVIARRKAATSLGLVPCFDIEVDHPDHLFVLANGLIVSNSMKHVTSASGPAAEYAGLDYLFQFTESPEEFKNRSVVAPKEGAVTDIKPAPQGGYYVFIGDEEVYVPQDRTLNVKPGDVVEAGDSLTDGLVDPEDIVNMRGVGEGRRYYSDKLGEIATASGAGMDRRNFETLARSAINHIELEDPEEEGFLPSDVVTYNEYASKRKLPEDIEDQDADAAVGKYLQVPALHYTPGTKITPKVAQRLKDTGFGKVTVSKQAPTFKPVMMRLQQAASFDDDWLARMGGSNLGRNLEDAKTRALDTNIEQNLHPVPRLAVAVGYADKLDTGKGF